MAFYLYDAALLLYADEVVFAKPTHRWTAGLGNGATLGGRYLAFPALLSPGSPVFRATWRAAPQAGASPAMADMLQALGPLRWHAWLLAMALFALVPMALTLHASHAWLLGLLLVLYLPTLLAVAYVARRRAALGLSRGDVAAIAVDVLACPPFALNLVRRITLRRGLAQPSHAFADAVLPAPARARLQRALEHRWALLADDAGGDGGDPA